MSPTWSRGTKAWVITACAIFFAIVIYLAKPILPPLVMALVLAFLLNPIVDRLSQSGRLHRGVATGIVYVVLVSLILLPFFFVPNLVNQIRAAIPDAPTLVGLARELTTRLRSVELFAIGPNLAAALEEPLTRFNDLLRQAGSAGINALSRFAGGVASFVVEFVFVLVASIYIVSDTPRILAYLRSLVPPAYQRDAQGLARDINGVWAGFFRGQLILCLSIGIVTGLVMWLLGIRYALWLGIIAGVLEILPNLGPVLSSVPAILIALFQGSYRFPELAPIGVTVAVIVAYILIQQIENHVFVPRIIGGSVNLHPVVTLAAVLLGASLFGILGIFLAAPTVATIRILGRYIRAKLEDRDPYPALAAESTVAAQPPAEAPADRPLPARGPLPEATERPAEQL